MKRETLIVSIVFILLFAIALGMNGLYSVDKYNDKFFTLPVILESLIAASLFLIVYGSSHKKVAIISIISIVALTLTILIVTKAYPFRLSMIDGRTVFFLVYFLGEFALAVKISNKYSEK